MRCIDKFHPSITAYLQITGGSNTKLFFKIYTRSEFCSKSPLEELAGWEFTILLFCSLTLWLVRDKHWGLQCNNEYEFNQVNRGLSDLLISLLWTSNMRCEAPTAGCAEVSLSSVVYAMTGLDNCPLLCCQSLCSIKWIGAFLGMKIF